MTLLGRDKLFKVEDLLIGLIDEGGEGGGAPDGILEEISLLLRLLELASYSTPCLVAFVTVAIVDFVCVETDAAGEA